MEEFDFSVVRQLMLEVPNLSNRIGVLTTSVDSLNMKTDSSISGIVEKARDPRGIGKGEDDKSLKDKLTDKFSALSPFSKLSKEDNNGNGKEKMFETDVTETPIMLMGLAPAALVAIGGLMAENMPELVINENMGTKGGGLLSSLFGMGGGGGGIGKMLMKSLPKIPGAALGLATNPVTWLIGGIIWGVVDAIRGLKIAETWGVSKTSGLMGGLLGGMDKGFKGAMKNMGKWALIGAGIGSLACPGVGTLVGGLIGGAVGAILGWIGGERIAKAFQKIGAWYKKRWLKIIGNIKGVIQFFIDLWKNPIATIKKLFAKIKNTVFKHVMWLKKNFVKMFSKLSSKLSTGWKLLKKKFITIYMFLPNKLKELTLWLKKKFVKIFSNMSKKLGKIFDKLKLSEIFDGVKNVVKVIKDKITNIISRIQDEILKLLGKIIPFSWHPKNEEEEQRLADITAQKARDAKDAYEKKRKFEAGIAKQVAERIAGQQETEKDIEKKKAKYSDRMKKNLKNNFDDIKKAFNAEQTLIPDSVSKGKSDKQSVILSTLNDKVTETVSLLAETVAGIKEQTVAQLKTGEKAALAMENYEGKTVLAGGGGGGDSGGLPEPRSEPPRDGALNLRDRYWNTYLGRS